MPFASMPGTPTVALTRMSGMEPELVSHRALLEMMAGLEFPYPAGRFAGRGMVICGGAAKYFPSVYVLVRLPRHLGAREMSAGMPHFKTVQSIGNTHP